MTADVTRRSGSIHEDIVLSITDLRVEVNDVARHSVPKRGRTLVHGVGLEVRRGQTVGLVGESGSGKTLTAMAAAHLLPPTLRVTAGDVRVEGASYPHTMASSRAQRSIAQHMGVIFQNPTASLNPRLRIASNFREVSTTRTARSGRQSWRAEAESLLEQVGISDPVRILQAFPHQLSGGLNQRVAIALALSRNPTVLVADEPTTALDVTVQARILDLIEEIKQTRHLGVLLISHDLDVIADRADEVHVMAAGRIVESGPTRSVLVNPESPDARRLIAARPRNLVTPHEEPPSVRVPLLEVVDVRKTFRTRRGSADHVALDGVSFALGAGESLGLVGESGSGKTTLARIVAGLETADSGRVTHHGPVEARRGFLRADVQYVFQNALAALDPYNTIAESIAEPLRLNRKIIDRGEIARRTKELADEVELTESQLRRRPTELSGGQCQRAVVARALANDPRLLIADEPVSALDLSVQSRVLELFHRLRKERELTYLFISHDLDVVSYLCERILVMYQGTIVESGATEQVLHAPRHQYTRQLIAAIPGEKWESRTDPANYTEVEA